MVLFFDYVVGCFFGFGGGVVFGRLVRGGCWWGGGLFGCGEGFVVFGWD